MASSKKQKNFCMMLIAVVFMSAMLAGCSILTKKEGMGQDDGTAGSDR